jgi:adenosylcobinamide-phosphate synthase
MTFATVMLIGLAVDAVLGWPKALFDRLSHPVVWIGAVISALETRINAGSARRRLLAGGLTVVLVLTVAVFPAVFVQAVLPGGWVGGIVSGLLAWPFIALRSMHDHVAAVRDPLVAGDLPVARHELSMIVGRDTRGLDQPGISRAALESLAENTSDGIVAPLFWGVVGGLPGIVAYKAINTMDSMIGHRSTRYEQFGKIAARLDDLVNLLPARLTGLCFAAVSGHFCLAMRIMVRDAGQHRSPNAGWPEAALAGALQIRLSGPRVYGDQTAQEPWVNGEAQDPQAETLTRGLALYRRAMLLCAACLATLAIV